MTTVRRSGWVSEQAGRTVDVNKTRDDAAARDRLEAAGVSMERLERADLDHDGKLSADEAWRVADAFDHDGKADSLVSIDAQGQSTAAGEALAVLGALFDWQAPPPPPASQRFFDGARLELPEAFVAQLASAHGDAAVSRLEAWATLVNEHQGAGEREKLDLVNDFFNTRVAYAAEPTGSDLWQSPLETLALGRGDCEDYAMAKFLTLRLLGLPADRLEVAVVRHATQGMHAVALVRDASGPPWVLDNLEAEPLRTPGRPELSPVVVVNEVRVRAVDSSWRPVGPERLATDFTRFRGAMERSAPVLTDAAFSTFGGQA